MTRSTSNQKEIDVWIQDQTTWPFHRYFMTEDKTDITLTIAATKDDTVLNVSSGHGFTWGWEYMLINYWDYAQQSKVLSVATDAITIESPIGINLPTSGTQIIRWSIEMNVNWSVTPVVFYCRPWPNAQPVDIQHLHVFMRDWTDWDQSTYWGMSALTNWLFVRYEDWVSQNLGNYKTNASFVQFWGIATYNDKAPSGEYSVDFNFDLKNNYGVVFRLDPEENWVIKATVQDDLTDLIQHRVVAAGQITLWE